VTPETPTLEAIETMRANRISCLPVVKNGHLVGVVTQDQYMEIAGRLLEEALRR
ncbi:MAG TPA: CBS domain-containing protein, partial [Acidobacteria bacterium]|nr:CBS domain-containing protein [Acidobacteriota bacterium]